MIHVATAAAILTYVAVAAIFEFYKRIKCTNYMLQVLIGVNELPTRVRPVHFMCVSIISFLGYLLGMCLTVTIRTMSFFEEVEFCRTKCNIIHLPRQSISSFLYFNFKIRNIYNVKVLHNVVNSRTEHYLTLSKSFSQLCIF